MGPSALKFENHCYKQLKAQAGWFLPPTNPWCGYGCFPDDTFNIQGSWEPRSVLSLHQLAPPPLHLIYKLIFFWMLKKSHEYAEMWHSGISHFASQQRPALVTIQNYSFSCVKAQTLVCCTDSDHVYLELRSQEGCIGSPFDLFAWSTFSGCDWQWKSRDLHILIEL